MTSFCRFYYFLWQTHQEVMNFLSTYSKMIDCISIIILLVTEESSLYLHSAKKLLSPLKCDINNYPSYSKRTNNPFVMIHTNFANF